MKYQWLEEDKSCQNFEAEFGCQVKSIKRGGLVTGYEDDFYEQGQPIKSPVIKQGIELDLEDETPEILERLDLKFGGLKREGGTGISKELSLLKARVSDLEAAIAQS